jgi:hypothetical protein
MRQPWRYVGIVSHPLTQGIGLAIAADALLRFVI